MEGEAEEEGEGKGAEEETLKLNIEAERMLYSHFGLYTPWRKVSQMVMHGEKQSEIKAKFNNQFNALLALKVW